MDLGGLGEFGFIQRLRERVGGPAPPHGIGDDGALLEAGDARLVATTDALIEDVHFRLSFCSPADIGWKAVVVNLSDLAAMGATPAWLLVVCGLPASTTGDVLDGLIDGMAEACPVFGCQVVGGDTVRSRELTLTITAIGVLDGPVLTRSGAEPGDVLSVTGPLGLAATGLNLLLSDDPKDVDPDDGLRCLGAYRRPTPRTDAGAALARAGAHAAIDLSDGLASDAWHVARASSVGVEIDADTLPIAAHASRVCDARGWDARAAALNGGEDYELLVAHPPDMPDDVGLLPVGRCVDGDGVWLVDGGDRRPLEPGGYDHFRT